MSSRRTYTNAMIPSLGWANGIDALNQKSEYKGIDALSHLGVLDALSHSTLPTYII